MATIKQYLPSLTWTIVLAFLFFMDASPGQFSFCIFRIAGFESCPGCGIGHAIHHALHFDLRASIEAHFLGLPSAFVLVFMAIKPLLPPKKMQQV